MTAEAKLQNVESQMRAVLKQETNRIACPFCGDVNIQPSELDVQPPLPLCCYDFALAIEAVILKFETDYHLNAAERIAESAERSAVPN